MTVGQASAYPRGRRNRWRVRLSDWRVRLREWLLEDSSNKGLGGPPNNWQSITVRAGSHSGNAEYGACFGDDASSIWISVRYPDEPGDGGRWLCDLRPVVFRRIALWYLWRWAYGEWFGLRRWLFYRWLHRHVARMQRRMGR
jgi:hypothetical protein